MSTAPNQDGITLPLAAVQELRTLGDALAAAVAAASAAEWGDDTAQHLEATKAQSTLRVLAEPGDTDLAAAPAEVVHAVRRARAAVADAVLAVARAHQVGPGRV
ncbi:MAG: hypothetical protein ACRDUB_22635, partial [Mycobacterium sp.]